MGEGFGDVASGYARGGFEIGEGARDPQDPVIATRG